MEVCPVFIDETGVLSSSLKEQPVYGIGLLIVPSPKRVTDSFYKLHFNFVTERNSTRNQIRRDILDTERQPSLGELNRLMWSSRHHEYKFGEVTRFNLQEYVDLLNLYFSFQDFEFHALIMDRNDPGFNLRRWDNDVWTAYASLTKTLLTRRVKRDAFVILDLQGKPDASSVYIEDVVCQVPHVKGCLRATSDMSVFLQIVDVLLGCIQFDWKDQHGYYGTASRRASEKRELTSFVKGQLGLTQNEPFLKPGLNYRRWSKKSRFSVWRWTW